MMLCLCQLGQGVLVLLSPSLIKRQKTHFHNLPCGASIILGNNGFVWLYPTAAQLDEEAGGFYTSVEVRLLLITHTPVSPHNQQINMGLSQGFLSSAQKEISVYIHLAINCNNPHRDVI